MNDYKEEMIEKMYYFSLSLNERDRRRYAAIESLKLGHGGIKYISEILEIDPKTISAGIKELQSKNLKY